jgi:hypothetical protein
MKFKDKYQTMQRHRYSKEFAKQAFLQALLQVLSHDEFIRNGALRLDQRVWRAGPVISMQPRR